MVAKLLIVPSKATDDTDVANPIEQYLKRIYGATQASELATDVTNFSALRRQIAQSSGGNPSGLDTVYRYYSALNSVDVRIPISKQRDHARITFTWGDAFKSQKKSSQSNVHFEKACIVFNVAAIKSQAALQVNRYDADGISEACKRFQEAAGAFAYVRDSLSTKIEAPRPVDFTSQCLTMLEKLMMAQAQECVYDKAVKDQKSPGTVARLAQQACALYGEVARLIDVSLAQHVDKAWPPHVAAKELNFQVEAMDQQAAAHHAKEGLEIGQEIAYLRQIKRILTDAKGKGRSPTPEVSAIVDHRMDSVNARLERLERDNNAVYLQRVPAATELPAIQPALLVKGTVPSEVVDVGEPTWFGGLIPQASTKAMNKYNTMVATLVSKAQTQMATAAEARDAVLRDNELPDILDSLGAASGSSLPPDIRQRLAEATAAGGVQHLNELSQQIRSLRGQTVADLDDCQQMVSVKCEEDSTMRKKYKSKWTLPPVADRMQQIEGKMAGYKGNLQTAGSSDAKVQARFQSQQPNLLGLTQEAAAAAMPPLLPSGNAAVDHDTLVATLRSGVQECEALATEREDLEEEAAATKVQDNILPRLMSHTGAEEELMTSELTKYDDLKTRVEQHLKRSKEAVDTIRSNGAKFRQAYNVQAWKAQCTARASDLRSKLDVYKELEEGLQEGMRFYTSLQEAVTTLRQYIQDFFSAREINKQELLEELNKSGGKSGLLGRLR